MMKSRWIAWVLLVMIWAAGTSRCDARGAGQVAGASHMGTACPTCHGAGSETCPTCQGSGGLPDDTCCACGGAGELTCSACHGTGRRAGKSRKLEAKLRDYRAIARNIPGLPRPRGD